MNHLDTLHTDLATHKKSLAAMRDPNYGKARNRKGGPSIESNINPALLIPSYLKIIKSIEDEIATLTSKKAAKKPAAKKVPVKVPPKKTVTKKKVATKKAPKKKSNAKA
jgi:hypothetical protein